MPSILQKLKDQRTSEKERKQILKDVKAEAYKHEKERVALEIKKKRAEAFLKDVEKAERAGIEKARVGGKTMSVKSLVKSAESTLNKTDAELRKAKKSYKEAEKVGSKALDLILGPKKSAKKKPATKRKTTTKKKTVTKKRTTTRKKKG